MMLTPEKMSKNQNKRLNRELAEDVSQLSIESSEEEEEEEEIENGKMANFPIAMWYKFELIV
jgi:hypothetical protein